MIRKMIILGLLIGGMVLPSCKKSEPATPRSVAYLKYTDEDEPIIVEEVRAQWENGTAMLIAEGYDHELLKLYLPNITCTGEVRNLSEQNISFSDGLDFESTKMLDGVITITDIDEHEVCGTFAISLLDDVGGVESRGIEGSFRIHKD